MECVAEGLHLPGMPYERIVATEHGYFDRGNQAFRVLKYVSFTSCGSRGRDQVHWVPYDHLKGREFVNSKGSGSKI